MTTTPRRSLTAKEMILVFGVIAVGFVVQDPGGSMGVVIVYVLSTVMILVAQALEERVAGWLFE